jgi:hypothetical protein
MAGLQCTSICLLSMYEAGYAPLQDKSSKPVRRGTLLRTLPAEEWGQHVHVCQVPISNHAAALVLERTPTSARC